MKKLFTVLSIVLFFAFFSNAQAQLAKDSWGFGFGATFPQLVSSNTTSEADELSFGGFLTLQRNFTEHSSLRFQGFFNHISYNWGPGLNMEGNTNQFGLGIDFLYSFVPCESVSPYLLLGVSGNYSMLDNPPNPNIDDYASYGVNAGLGFDIDLSEDWSLTPELAYHAVRDSRIDGQYGTGRGGIFGSNDDGYFAFKLGLMYTFSKGEPSQYCQLYEGISADVPEIDYERIENIVKKHIPEVVETQVVVEKEAARQWVLVGVNFDFNKATLRDESYPILFHAVQTLLTNPEMRVEIQGHTDSIASEEYNMKLGQRRAETVKDYLVSRGVSADRLVVRSYGESQPIADNSTASGRQINRRVEFKVLN